MSFGREPKTYCFDHVFDSSDQDEIYGILVKPLVEKAFEGYNCTFLASGQTGSGKTCNESYQFLKFKIWYEKIKFDKNNLLFKIFTDTMGFDVNTVNNGMTPRVLKSIFSHPNTPKVSVSFIEVYNERAFDLLGQNPQEPFKKGTSQSGIRKIFCFNQN